MKVEHKYNVEDIVYDIGGNKGIISCRRTYEYSTGGYVTDYFVEFPSGSRWIDVAALFTERPADSY